MRGNEAVVLRAPTFEMGTLRLNIQIKNENATLCALQHSCLQQTHYAQPKIEY